MAGKGLPPWLANKAKSGPIGMDAEDKAEGPETGPPDAEDKAEGPEPAQNKQKKPSAAKAAAIQRRLKAKATAKK